MSDPEFAAWVAEAIPAYALEKIASGQWSEEASLALAKKDFDELLPQGIRTPDSGLFAIVDSRAVTVGTLCFTVKTRFDARIAYVFDVKIRPERQREGHAYHAFLALENEIRNLGLFGIALHVFGHNVAARGLYAKLGYHPTNISLFKPVGPAAA